ILGWGNVGSWAARFAAFVGSGGGAVSYVHGGVYAPQGLDVRAAWEHAGHRGSLEGLEGAEPITNDDLLELDVEVLIPAALGEVITEHNADRVQADLIVEAANHPVTPPADAALHDRGVLIVPDILANAGGVIVSYFEWVQNNQEMRWDLEDVNRRLERKLSDAYRECRDFQAAHDGERLSLREAAFSLAVERVVHVASLRGYL
ncbi:MAG: glutamate dehydrogenase, partial [Nitriliruptoraceae bacterium]|nr:glutamate dehydrogenase [Nitriliruptoraceae bacterium]